VLMTGCSVICLVVAAYKLYFHVKYSITYPTMESKTLWERWCEVFLHPTFPQLVLLFEVLANTFFTLYNAVDPLYLRKSFSLYTGLIILIIAIFWQIFSLFCFWLYWFHLTKEYRLKLQFFLNRPCGKNLFCLFNIWYSSY